MAIDPPLRPPPERRPAALAHLRFDEAQVAEILAEATRPDVSSGAAEDGGRVSEEGRGITLGELRSIGREVGIPEHRIEAAAQALLLRDQEVPGATLLGAPRTSNHLVLLDAPLDDAAWERLVSHLRQTFRARGTVSAVPTSEGTVRSWRNGHLQVHVEPDPSGLAPWRLRAQTFKGDAGGSPWWGDPPCSWGALPCWRGWWGAWTPPPS